MSEVIIRAFTSDKEPVPERTIVFCTDGIWTKGVYTPERTYWAHSGSVYYRHEVRLWFYPPKID